MGNEIFKITPQIQQVNKSLDSLPFFDLPTLVEKMKHEHSWENGELNAMVLLKTPSNQMVLTILHSKTEIQSFQANDSITFQIVEGCLTFHTRKKSIDLDKGQILSLRENIKYSLTAKEETVLLLIIESGALEYSKN